MRFGNSNTFHAIAIAALFVLITISVSAAADMTVTNAWMRALPASVPSGGYFTLYNRGLKPAILTGASSPACGMLMLHKTSSTDGRSRMNALSEVEVPAGGMLSFGPGGYHLMCMKASALLKAGATVPITLAFKDGASLMTPFRVRNAVGK